MSEGKLEDIKLPTGAFEILDDSGIRVAVYAKYKNGIKMDVLRGQLLDTFLVPDVPCSPEFATAIFKSYKIGWEQGRSFGVSLIRSQMCEALGIPSTQQVWLYGREAINVRQG